MSQNGSWKPIQPVKEEARWAPGRTDRLQLVVTLSKEPPREWQDRHDSTGDLPIADFLTNLQAVQSRIYATCSEEDVVKAARHIRARIKATNDWYEEVELPRTRGERAREKARAEDVRARLREAQRKLDEL